MKNQRIVSPGKDTYVVPAKSIREDYEKYPADKLIAYLNDTASFNPSGVMPDITPVQKIF